MAVSLSHHSYIESLRKQHMSLTQEIEEAQKMPSTNDFFLVQLKKRRLLVKEKMERYQSSGA